MLILVISSRLGAEFVIVAGICVANTLQEGPVAIQKIFQASRRQMWALHTFLFLNNSWQACYILQESSRSMHYVPMDFSTKSGRIISQKDIQGQMTKEGYTYFRRKIEPTNVDHLLTETQATIHKDQPWFHKGVSRDLSQKILASHCTDGWVIMTYFFRQKNALLHDVAKLPHNWHSSMQSD